jgi:chromate transporter
MGAVAAGLIIGTAFRLAPALRRNPMGVATCVAFGAATFVLVALLRFPLPWVLLGLGALACTVAWFRIRTRVVVEAVPPPADVP